MTLQEAYFFYSNKLAESNNNPSLEAIRLQTRIVFRQSLSIPDSVFILNPQMILTPEQQLCLETIFAKLLQGIPLAYALNSQFFWKHDFYVNENVLIPRGDSETLIQAFLDHFSDKNQALSILEIGVGSGCLILSLLDEYKQAQGVGVDVSPEALDVCLRNSHNIGINTAKERLALLKSDLFEKVERRFDVIISNPPYIDENDSEIAENVKTFEPKLALFAKNNGLYFYEKILQQAKAHLNVGGMIFFEIGYTQNRAVISLAEQNGLVHVATKQDLAGKDRVVILRIES